MYGLSMMQKKGEIKKKKKSNQEKGEKKKTLAFGKWVNYGNIFSDKKKIEEKESLKLINKTAVIRSVKNMKKKRNQRREN